MAPVCIVGFNEILLLFLNRHIHSEFNQLDAKTAMYLVELQSNVDISYRKIAQLTLNGVLKGLL